MGVLSIDNVSFRYSKDSHLIFDNLNYEFAPGELTALVGPSGTGKSTLLYVLGLMLAPSKGTVRFEGNDISSMTDYERSTFRSGQIGFVFQESELDAFRPIIESVCEPGLYQGKRFHDVEARGRSLLRYVGLEDHMDKKPNQISGGQGQRAAIARSVINDPAIILADEPTGNLDRDNADIILRLLANQADQGKTVIIATHDPFVKDACTSVFDVSKGGQ